MLPENTTHSFVIKVWVEDVTLQNGQTIWRGHITHIPSKRRRYFDDYRSLQQFIEAYLQVSDLEDPTSED
jgi:hypothetical protein